jgi:CxxC motif-containing protein (DUF1111 family)
MRIRFALLVFALLTVPTAMIGLAQDGAYLALLGGRHTVFDESPDAFTHSISGYDESQTALFEQGDELFDRAYTAESGLGPLFNAVSCGSCHQQDGRGRPPAGFGETQAGLLIRFALHGRNGNQGHSHGNQHNQQQGNNQNKPVSEPDATYGGQLQDLALPGVPVEGNIHITYEEIRGAYADGTPYTLVMPHYEVVNLGYGGLDRDITFSPRVANQMTGLGLLEAISESTLFSFADPEDANQDGISGRPNMVLDYVTNSLAIGRFGWKSNQPNLLQQAAGAFNGDMGITSSLFPNENCTTLQANCLTAPDGVSSIEISDEELQAVALYSRSLAVPSRRNTDDPTTQRGETLFAEARCSACHIPSVDMGSHPTIPQIMPDTIHPYTDLLLHDMGPGLADGQVNFLATGSEWRTAPLWGIGLFETVNHHTNYLHDGRARNLEEAILWHDGEASASRTSFLMMSAADREALLAFLRSL